MDIRKLKTILDLFENSSLAEIEFCEGEERIRLSKNSTVAVAGIQAAAAPAAAPVIPAAPAEPAAPAAAKEEAIEGTVVKSPMVGTFYRSPSPDKPSFVSVGTKVQKGDTLCIVEAMKLMNEIPSPVAGTVQKILVENHDAVGFGTDLFIIS